MCRWIAYSGKPITLDTLITRPAQSLIEQSLHSRLSFRADGSVLPTNGDGFGMGWYSGKEEPGLFKVPDPAWSNENIKELCAHISAPLFMAHIRAASTGAIQRSNAHPFKYRNWLFQHNGYINGFEQLRRALHSSITEEYYPGLRGTTDSETFFLLALSYGLQENPKAALERALLRVREVCDARDIAYKVIFSCALSDGEAVYTMRYASGEHSHSQYYSTHADCLKELNEHNESMPRKSVVIVSEPLDQSAAHWEEMPPSSYATLRNGKVTIEELTVPA